LRDARTLPRIGPEGTAPVEKTRPPTRFQREPVKAPVLVIPRSKAPHECAAERPVIVYSLRLSAPLVSTRAYLKDPK